MKIDTNIEDGKFKRNRNWILRALQQFEGKNITLTIEQTKSKRSNPQNKYYWGLVIPLIKEGLYNNYGQVFNTETIHYYLLSARFAPVNTLINEDTGEVIDIKIRTSEMSKTQFSDYILEIQKFAAEFLNIEIPLPNEKLELF